MSNSIEYRNKFCPRGIVAFHFTSTCHVDAGDNQSFCFDSMKSSLQGVVGRLEELKKMGLESLDRKIKEANICLRHISWWGVSLPTTCCYQYISDVNSVEVYQWFLCPGLGTSYRIRNYWVHLFLASTFSHCTSGAIYIVKGRAYFGKCPHVTMFSWGGY